MKENIYWNTFTETYQTGQLKSNMASMRTSASALGATQNPSKIAPSKDSFKNKSQSQILNSRKPLQAIDKNLAATRVQPSRQAKRKQQKAFDIFQDEENKSESFENVSPKAGASKGDRKQVQQKKIGLTTSAVSTTACAAPSAAPFASSSATALMCPSIAASSLTSGPHFGAKISVALAVDPLVGAASSVAADVPSSSHRNDTIGMLTNNYAVANSWKVLVAKWGPEVAKWGRFVAKL